MVRAKRPKPTYMVVDTNMLQSNDLEQYLSARVNNYAVIPDHTAMEAYKSGTLAGIFEAMGILVKFPAQIVVLKGTRNACSLVGSYRTIRSGLIDRSQTVAFLNYSKQIAAARSGSAILLARSLLTAHPEVNSLPSFDNLPSHYLFRYALSVQVWILGWIARGSPQAVKKQKIINDLLDLNIATCATYFDGLLSNDAKMQTNYSKSRFLPDQIT